MTSRAGEVDGVRPPDRVPALPAPGEEGARQPRRERAKPPRAPRPEPATPEQDGSEPPEPGEKGSLVDIHARAGGRSLSFCTVPEMRGGRSCRVQWKAPASHREFVSRDAIG